MKSEHKTRAGSLPILFFLALTVVVLGACSAVGLRSSSATPKIQLVTVVPGSTQTRPSNSSPDQPTENRSGIPTISVNSLPPEARQTIVRIGQGGPFPYREDGQVFQNREVLLPSEPPGYYHEYTVETPGESDRGARRIITGAGGEMYYTDDHNASFKRIVQ